MCSHLSLSLSLPSLSLLGVGLVSCVMGTGVSPTSPAGGWGSDDTQDKKSRSVNLSPPPYFQEMYVSSSLLRYVLLAET